MAFICKMTDTAGVTGPVASGIYGTCSSAADATAKVGTCTDLDKLIVGCVIYIKFDNANTKADATLNVNSLGALKIVSYGTTGVGANTTSSWRAGEVVGFMYDEVTSGSTTTGYWRMIDNHAMFTTTSVGSATAGTAIPADDITAWTTNTPTSVTYEDVTATYISAWSAGTAPSLKWVARSIPNVTGVGSLPSLKWTSATASKVTLGTALTASKVTKATVTIPNVTGNTSVTIPNVTGNTSVTVKSVKTINNAIPSATISEGVLTFGTPTATVVTEDKTATNTTLGTALSASKVTLGTALTANTVTITDVSIPNVTAATDVNTSYLGTSSETTPSWSAGSLPTLGTAITASYLGTSSETSPSWSAGTVPSMTKSNVTATHITAYTAGVAAALSYTAKSIPNITVSSKTVVALR